jgi:hypothetical protein
MRIALALLLLSTTTALADDATTVDAGRDTARLSLSVSDAMFASYPQSIEDDGFALGVAKPLWLGTRYQYFQWDVDALVVGGMGGTSHSVYLGVGPQVGFNLYLGSVFGFELQMGLAGIGQLGSHSVLGAGFLGSGGYVFRFWKDDRKRLKLLVTLWEGGYFASDPGNDLGTNAMMMAVGLAYEMPL